MRAASLFPVLDPLTSAYLDVGDGYQLYFETCGNPQALPVLALHGGPGSGSSPKMRSLYDPERCHTVFFDQRGCGRSLPAGALHANDLNALIADIERLRRHLGIDRWLVSGGSWGATLALAYAVSAPEAVRGLLLRSVFIADLQDLQWFFQGAANLVPEAWQKLAGLVAPTERDDLLAALHKRLFGNDPMLASQVALAWANYEQSLAQPGQALTDALTQVDPATLEHLLKKYRIQAHYLTQHCFLGEAGVLGVLPRLPAVPVAIVHGRADRICLPENVRRLQRAIPGSCLAWAEGAGHDPFHPAVSSAWINFLRNFAERGVFADPAFG